jgi:hypothetical protein
VAIAALWVWGGVNNFSSRLLASPCRARREPGCGLRLIRYRGY